LIICIVYYLNKRHFVLHVSFSATCRQQQELYVNTFFLVILNYLGGEYNVINLNFGKPNVLIDTVSVGEIYAIYSNQLISKKKIKKI
jgi:hypothetical protein